MLHLNVKQIGGAAVIYTQRYGADEREDPNGNQDELAACSAQLRGVDQRETLDDFDDPDPDSSDEWLLSATGM